MKNKKIKYMFDLLSIFNLYKSQEWLSYIFQIFDFIFFSYMPLVQEPFLSEFSEKL